MMFFFCKQKTAYEMRISDWSSDVCSSDLPPKVPTPVEFAVNVVVTDTQCPPDVPACTYTYTIEPKYIGLHPLPETPFTVFYEVVGGNTPQKGEFTVHKDQAKILKIGRAHV